MGIPWPAGGSGGGSSPTPHTDDMTGVGWDELTATGGGDASWAADKLTLDCGAGSASSCGVERAAYLPSGDYYDAAINVKVTSGDNSSQTRIILAVGQSSTNCANVALFTNGSIETGHVAGGSYTFWNVASTISGIDATARTGGALWLRVHRSPLAIAWYWGLGSAGALPTVWNLVYSSVEREVAGAFNTAQAGLRASNGRYISIAALTISAVNLDVEVLAIKTGAPGAFGGA